MRRLACLLTGMLVVLVLGSDSPKEYDDNMELASIEGTWQLLAVVHDGEKVNPITWVLTFRGGKLTRKDSDGDNGEGVYKFDTTQKPYQLDLIPGPGAKFARGWQIAEIHGDILKTAWDRTYEKRPRSFHDQDLWFGTFKRLK